MHNSRREWPSLHLTSAAYVLQSENITAGDSAACCHRAAARLRKAAGGATGCSSASTGGEGPASHSHCREESRAWPAILGSPVGCHGGEGPSAGDVVKRDRA